VNIGEYSPSFTEPEANNCLSIIFRGAYQGLPKSGLTRKNTDASTHAVVGWMISLQYIDSESIYSSSSAIKQTNKGNTRRHKFSCHRGLKMSSCSLKKNMFRSINLTCWRSMWPLRFTILKWLEDEFLKRISGPRARGVISKILHPFIHLGLGVMSSE